jgi:hypothetical protein
MILHESISSNQDHNKDQGNNVDNKHMRNDHANPSISKNVDNKHMIKDLANPNQASHRIVNFFSNY